MHCKCSELFYVRNHLPVPVVDPEEYILELEGPGGETQSLTLEDLKTKFPKVSVTSVVQCAGNRRSELNKVLDHLLIYLKQPSSGTPYSTSRIMAPEPTSRW